MSQNRKLLGDIDRVLKKVKEGVDDFDEILERVSTASSANQREKFEGELKKCIKKLQRFRDQIKGWIGSNDVKDKRQLVEARKIIENRMERFRAAEKESKTKTYSRAGMSQAKVDERVLAIREWTEDISTVLREQNKTMGDEIVLLNSKAGKNRQTSDPEALERIVTLECAIERNTHHLQCLEIISRRVGTKRLTVDQVEEIKPLVEAYSEQNLEPDYYEDDDIYASVRVDPSDPDGGEDEEDQKPGSGESDEEGGSDVDSGFEDDEDESDEQQLRPKPPADSPPAPKAPPSPREATSSTVKPADSDSVLGKGRKAAAAASATTTSPPAAAAVVSTPVVASTPASTVKQPAKTTTTTATSSLTTGTPSAAAATPATTTKVASSIVTPATTPAATPATTATTAAATTATATPSTVASKPPVEKAPAPVSVGRGTRTAPPAKTPTAVPPPAQTIPPPQQPQQPALQPQPAQASYARSVKGRGAAITAPTPSTVSTPAAAESQVPKASSRTSPSSTPPVSPNLAPQPTPVIQPPSFVQILASPGRPTAPTTAATTNGQVVPPAAAFPPLPSASGLVSAGRGVHHPATAPPPPSASAVAQPTNVPATQSSTGAATTTASHGNHATSLSYQLQMLEASATHMPEETEKPKYRPKNPVATPSYYPQERLALFDSPPAFEKLDIDALFYIFYYQQGTYQQYIAAKELKHHGWRYHKKYLTWFQRHEQPKERTDDYEQGTYLYFDYETGSGWCQRKKDEFRFEYAYLEEDL